MPLRQLALPRSDSVSQMTLDDSKVAESAPRHRHYAPEEKRKVAVPEETADRRPLRRCRVVEFFEARAARTTDDFGVSSKSVGVKETQHKLEDIRTRICALADEKTSRVVNFQNKFKI
jgi:hypothetical protein